MSNIGGNLLTSQPHVTALNGKCPDDKEFHCLNNVCIETVFLCDGDNSCGDNSDEATEVCRSNTGDWYIGLVVFFSVAGFMVLVGALFLGFKKKYARVDSTSRPTTFTKPTAENQPPNMGNGSSVVSLPPNENAKTRMYSSANNFYASETFIAIELNERRASGSARSPLSSTDHQAHKSTGSYPKQQYTLSLADDLPSDIRTSDSHGQHCKL